MVVSYFALSTIYCVECEIVLSNFPDESVDLICPDPPFFSDKQHCLNTREENEYSVNAWTEDGEV
jgi:hypothetical protein